MKIAYKLFSFLLIIGFSSCIQNEIQEEDFIQIKDQQFYLNDQPHFIYMLNYVINLREVGGEVLFGATVEYENKEGYDSKTPEEVRSELNKHFKLIAEMGFNTVRVVGVQKLDYTSLEPNLAMRISQQTDEGSTFQTYNVTENMDKVIKAIEPVIEAAKTNDLKVMILLPRPNLKKEFNRQRLAYIKAILQNYSEESTVFAYDFFNEPLYFDNSEYPINERKYTAKKEANTKTRYWKKLMGKYAPNQLSTIGTAEPIEAFHWDPSMLEVDFLSFHTYNPLRVKNEIYWYAKNINKPWMVGETGLPTDNDSIPYIAKKKFIKESLQQVVDCGGAGYGLWQFQDVAWDNFEHNFLGMLNHDGGVTYTQDGDSILGSLKDPDLPYFPKEMVKGDCNCDINYYNMLGYQNYMLEGKIVDEKNQPIEDAVIRAWSKEWIGVNTFTQPDGTFKLYSNTPMVHFSISATGRELLKFDDEELEYKAIENLKDTTLENEFLEYQKLHFKNLLREGSFEKGFVFDFDEELFDTYKFRAEMEELQLSKVKLFPKTPKFLLGWNY